MKKLSKILLSTLVAVLLGFSFAACGGSRLTAIEIVSDTTEFVAGDVISTEFVSVNAKYADGSSRTVTGWTADITGALEQGEHTVTITYTENGVTVSATLDVTVSETEHVHEFGAEWQSDDVAHFRVCACGARTDEAAHIRAGITVTAEADCVTDGTRAYVCAVCDREGEEKLAALGHSFNIDRLDDNSHWKDCARCNASSQKLAHDFILCVDNVKTEWFDGDTFTLDGATAHKECDCGYASELDIATVVSSKTELNVTDGGELTLTCGELTTTINIDVKRREIIGIEIDPSTKNVYLIGEAFGGGTLVITYNNSSTTTTELTVDMIKGFDTNSVGERTFEVEYDGKKCELAVKIGYDAQSGAYELGTEKRAYKLQAEDETYVDMSGAALQKGTATNKFENQAKDGNNQLYPNGAEGYSTCNITKPGNKIVINFHSRSTGKFKLGLRAQSGNKAGKSDVAIDAAFSVKVNNSQKKINGNIAKASLSGNNWQNMTNWTTLEDIAGELDIVVGLNTIEFAYLGTLDGTGDLRFPNIDYFIITLI